VSAEPLHCTTTEQHHQWADRCTPTIKLPEAEYQHAIERAADAALDSGTYVVVVGVTDGRVLACLDGCCIGRPGVVVVVSDVKEAEFTANGQPPPVGTWRLKRYDGRTVALFRGTGDAQ